MSRPATARRFHAIDTHTAGMPTRVVTDGVGVLPGATMAERARLLARGDDQVRALLMNEPRGHSAMSGAILQPPCRADADWGIVFIEVSGYLPMCGHGTIGVATALVEAGMVEVSEPETRIRLDVPAGLVEARVEIRDRHAVAVTIRNVPAFYVGAGRAENGLEYELAFGGNFYAIAAAASIGAEPVPDDASRLVVAGLELMAAVGEPVHPADPAIRGCRHVLWTGPPRPGADARAATAIHPGWLDRSPCGTGTSARMALLHARGELGLGEPFVHESVLGTRFSGRLVERTEVAGHSAVVAEITGSAWVTRFGDHLLDPGDPLPSGFRLGPAA